MKIGNKIVYAIVLVVTESEGSTTNEDEKEMKKSGAPLPEV